MLLFDKFAKYLTELTYFPNLNFPNIWEIKQTDMPLENKYNVDYSKEVLERRMGLKKRMTREEEIMKLREKTAGKK